MNAVTKPEPTFREWVNVAAGAVAVHTTAYHVLLSHYSDAAGGVTVSLTYTPDEARAIAAALLRAAGEQA